jgi:hypothetical protein
MNKPEAIISNKHFSLFLFDIKKIKKMVDDFIFNLKSLIFLSFLDDLYNLSFFRYIIRSNI